MELNFFSAKIVGHPNSENWTQIYEFSPKDEGRKERGSIWAIISLARKESSLDITLVGREIITRLNEEYYGTSAGSPFECLKKALEKIALEFSGDFDLEMAAISFVEGTLYLACIGGGRIVLVRGEVVTTLLQSGNKSVFAASGYPKENDVFMLTTHDFLEVIPHGLLKGQTAGKDPKDAAESLASFIHSQDNEAGLGVLILKFSKDLKKHADDSYEEDRRSKDIQKIVSIKGSISNLTRSFLKETAKKLTKREIYIQSEEKDLYSEKRKKVSVTVGGILFLILLVSILFGIKQRREKDFKLSYEDKLASAKYELEEANKLYSLNEKRSRELFEGARSKVLGLSDRGIKDNDLKDLESRIRENEEKILGEYQSEPQLFVDLGLLTDGFWGERIVSAGKDLFILDRNSKKIVKTSIETKRSEIVAGPSAISEAEEIAAYTDRIFVSESKGINEIGRGIVIQRDWMGQILPFSYAGNFYILDKSSSSILRYSGYEEGFGPKKIWLSESTSSDLREANAWVIDGSVWILKENGNILKFNAGNEERFSISGVTPTIEKPLAIFTSDDAEFFYVLEPNNKRVVVLTKRGEYKAQYLFSQAGDAKGFCVSEEEKKIVILTGDKLYSIGIKHLD